MVDTKVWLKGIWEWFILPLWFLKCYRLDGKLPDYCWSVLYFISNKDNKPQSKDHVLQTSSEWKKPTYAFHYSNYLEIYEECYPFFIGEMKDKRYSHFFWFFNVSQISNYLLNETEHLWKKRVLYLTSRVIIWNLRIYCRNYFVKALSMKIGV